MTQNNKRGWIFGLSTLVFASLVFGFYLLRMQSASTSLSDPAQSESPAYQTGKAFEVIEAEKPAFDSSQLSAEQLIAEGDRIILETRKTTDQLSLDGVEISTDHAGDSEERLAKIQQRIDQLEQLLD